MMTNAKVGAALVGGYLLGRTKKAKLAIGLGMFLAGKKLDLDPRAVKRFLTESPLVGALGTQVRDELLGATKSAASRALTHRVTGLADSLHERTRGIGSGGGDDEPRDGDDEPDDEPRDEADDADDADEPRDDADADDEKPAPRRKKAAPRSSSGRSAAKPAAKRAASGGRTAARKAPARKSTAKSGGQARKSTRRSSGGDDA